MQMMLNKIHTKMTSNKMKYWMQKNIVYKAEEYGDIHKNTNQNEPVDINKKELEGNIIAYVSDTRVSSGGSYLI